jgi:hypothetical protein
MEYFTIKLEILAYKKAKWNLRISKIILKHSQQTKTTTPKFQFDK